MKTFSNKSNAQRAARKELGGDAFPGVDFHIVPVGNKFAWKPGKPDPETFVTDRAADTMREQLAATPPTDDEMIHGKGVGKPLGIANQKKSKPKAKTPKAKTADKPARETKAAKALALMGREGGVTGAELQAEFGWASHTVRGFISGHVRKKLGLDVDAEREGATTRYRILSAEEAAGEG